MICGVDDAAVARFRRDCLAIVESGFTPAMPIGVAVSGGPDSLALLLLAAAAWPGAVRAATVDHRLRAQAAEEAAMVAETCRELGVPHATLVPEVPIAGRGNVPDRARQARYALLGEWAGPAGWIATAHQCDDVAETFLMRARRGAGLGGLAAMRAERPLVAGSAGPRLIRPLLGWRRAELAAIVVQAGRVAADDPSNRDPHYDRARIRALLAEADDLPVPRLAMAANNLREAEVAIAWAAAREWTARAAVRDGRVRLEAADDLPRELVRRLTVRAVDTVRQAAGLHAAWRQTGIDRLIATLRAGGIGTIAGVIARPRDGSWWFDEAPARRSH